MNECGYRYDAYTIAIVDEHRTYSVYYSNLAFLEEPDYGLIRKLLSLDVPIDIVLKSITPAKVINVRLLFKYCFEVKPLLIVRRADGRIEVLEGRFSEFRIPSWGDETVVYPKKYWLYSIPHPADIVAVDGVPYYKLQRKPLTTFSYPREGLFHDELMKGLDRIKNFVARRFAGLVTYSKLDPLTRKRYFYRYVPYTEPLLTLDIGIILPEDRWTRLDIQLDKNKHVSEAEIVEKCVSVIDDVGGFLVKSSSRGYHLVVPTSYAPLVATKLSLEGIHIDDTTVVSENYFRMPYSFHWKTMEQATLVYVA